MKTKITTCGSNWKATVEVDPDICGDPYMEGATRALEYIFGNGPDTADDVKIVIPKPNEELNVGLLLQMYKTEDELDETKHKYVATIRVSMNAGLPWMTEQLNKFMANLKSGVDL